MNLKACSYRWPLGLSMMRLAPLPSFVEDPSTWRFQGEGGALLSEMVAMLSAEKSARA